MANEMPIEPGDKTLFSEDFLQNSGQMAALIRNKDWSKTPLGDIKQWPQSLHTTVSICIHSKFPILIWWGQNYTKIYNDAYREIIGIKHPSALGSNGKDVWPEIWDIIGPMLDKVFKTGEATWSENQQLLLNRKGYIEETYFTFSYSPIYVESGKIGGVFTAVTETTTDVLGKRHQKLLVDLEKNIHNTKTVDTLYHNLIETFNAYSLDFPYASIYKIDEKNKKAKLIANTGKTFPYDVGYKEIDLTSKEDVFTNFLTCINTKKPVLVQNVSDRMGVLPENVWKTNPNEGIFLPIKHFSRVLPLAVIVVSVNPHLKIDEQYQSFFQFVIEQVEKSIDKLFLNEKKKLESDFLSKENKEFNNMLVQTPASLAIFKGPEFIIEIINDSMLRLLGISDLDSVQKRPLLTVLNKENANFFTKAVSDVYQSGDKYQVTEPVSFHNDRNEEEEAYVNFLFEVLRDDTGTINGVIALGSNVEKQVDLWKNIEESQEQLKLAIESAELGTFSWELPQTKLIFSERTAQIYGYAGSKNLTQEDLQKSIHPDDRHILEEAYEKSKTTGSLDYECRLLWPDGSVHWINVRSTVLYNDQSVPMKLYGTVRDVTVQKLFAANLENKIKLSEERFQKVTEEVEDYAIILLSPKGDILNWNRGAEKIKGYSESEIIGKNFNIFYTPEDKRNKVPEMLIKEAAEKGRAIHEGYRIKKNGVAFWGATVITALHNEKNEITGFSKITRDLTERKMAEDQLRSYTKELEFQNKELEQFAYIASHDLQEPLRVIRLYSQLLKRDIDDGKDSDVYFKKINLAAQRMQDLIKSVLNYSRLTSIEKEYSQIDLNKILENVKSDFELLIRETKTTIKSDKLPIIYGVQLQIHQLFSNLISNSIKFCKKDPVIKISSKILNRKDMEGHKELNPLYEYVELKFEDNGIGFEQEYEDKIFEVFQRLHEKQQYSGTGVGLALCKKIIVNHNGLIKAFGETDKGSVFVIYLPINNQFGSKP